MLKKYEIIKIIPFNRYNENYIGYITGTESNFNFCIEYLKLLKNNNINNFINKYFEYKKEKTNEKIILEKIFNNIDNYIPNKEEKSILDKFIKEIYWNIEIDGIDFDINTCIIVNNEIYSFENNNKSI